MMTWRARFPNSLQHPTFGRYPRWEGRVPENFIVNFLGVLTRTRYWPPYVRVSRRYPSNRYVNTEYPPFDEEYFEWIDLLEAIAAAEGHFTMLELGAGWGRWTANAAAALRLVGNLSATFIAVEAEPTHFGWMVQHFSDNSIDSGDVRLIHAAVARTEGKVGFHVGQTRWGGPANFYGQSIGGPDLVDSVSLNTLLRPLQTVDLIDLDIQGTELEVLEAAAEEVDQKVKRVHIGTHGGRIEGGLRSLFSCLGWECSRCFASGASVSTEWGTISFQDGVQTWLNPTYFSRGGSDLQILTSKLEASRREARRLQKELENVREERGRVRTLEEGSLAAKIIDRGGQLRDRIAPVGTRRRAVLNLITKRI